MDVRLPDGRVIQGVPEGTTKAQLVERLRTNGVIDDAMAGQMLPQEAPSASEAPTITPASAQPAVTASAAEPGVGEKMLVNLGRGFTDVGEGFAQTALALSVLLNDSPASRKRFDDYTREADAERAEFEGRDISDGVTGVGSRVTGNIAGFLLPGGFVAKGLTKLAPAAVSGMAATTGGRLALGGAAGAAEGATSFVPEGDSRAIATIGGAMLGAGAGEVAFRIARKLQGKRGVDAFSVVLDELPASVPESQRLRIARDVSEGLTLEQALRRAEIESIPGVTATQGRVTQGLDQLAFEHEQLRHSGPISELEQANRRAVFDEADRMVGDYTRTTENYDAGASVQDALTAGKGSARTATREAYEQADAAAGAAFKPTIRMQGGQWVAEEGKEIFPLKIQQALRQNIDSFSTEELAPVVSVLKRNNVLTTDETGLLQVVEGSAISPKEIATVRRQLNKVRTKDRATKAMLAEVKQALDKDVVTSVGRDIYREARSIAKAEFDLFDNRQKVQAIIDGVIQPDDIIKRARSDSFKVKDVTEILDTLEKVDPKAANDFRGGVLRSLVSDLRGRGDRGGVPEVNFQTFRNNLDKLGRAKLEAIYGRTGARAINDFASAVGALTRVDKGVANPGTAGALSKLWKVTKGVSGRVAENVPIATWLVGAHRAVRAANLGEEAKRRALRAIDVEILKRQQIEDRFAESMGFVTPVVAGGAASAAL